jgi:uncharacterized protein (DUF2384 family)
MSPDKDLRELERVVARIVQESACARGFDAHQWMEKWMSEPLPALAGERPLDILAQPGGLEKVRTVLLRMQSGAFS